MKIISTTLGLILAAGLAACGSSTEQRDTKSMPASVADTTASAEQPFEEQAVMSDHDVNALDEHAEEPIAMPPVEKSVARAELATVRSGNAIGTVTFEQEGDVVTIAGTFEGIKAGLHGLQIREGNSCGKRGREAGGHFNPTGSKHGPPSSAERHAGDLGNVEVSDDGRASYEISTDSLTVTTGADSVVGRTLVLTARKDTGKRADGGAGAVIACSVIAAAGQESQTQASN